MCEIEQIILVINEVNVTLVGVQPNCRPRVNDYECVAAVYKLRSSTDHRHMVDAEGVRTTKIGPKTVVRNATLAPATGALSLLRLFLALLLRGLGLFAFLLLLWGRLGLIALLFLLWGRLGLVALLLLLRGRLGLLSVFVFIRLLCVEVEP